MSQVANRSNADPAECEQQPTRKGYRIVYFNPNTDSFGCTYCGVLCPSACYDLDWFTCIRCVAAHKCAICNVFYPTLDKGVCYMCWNKKYQPALDDAGVDVDADEMDEESRTTS